MNPTSLRTGMTIETNGVLSFTSSADFADDGLKFPITVPRNFLRLFQSHLDLAHSVPQTFRDSSHSRLIEAFSRRITHIDQIETFLDDLRLAYRQAIKDRVEPVNAAPVARDQHIVGATFDAGDQRQLSPTPARHVLTGGPEPVAVYVANQRHIGVEQTGAYQPPGDARRRGGIIIIVKRLDTSRFGPQVQPAIIAFAGRRGDLAQAVGFARL